MLFLTSVFEPLLSSNLDGKEKWYDPKEKNFLAAPTSSNFWKNLAIFLLGAAAGGLLFIYKGREYVINEFSDLTKNQEKVKKMISLNPPHDGYRLRTYFKTWFLMKSVVWFGLVDSIDLSAAMTTLSYGLSDTDWSHRYLVRALINNAFKHGK
jgi:hypothetical protein